jgi:hypothetical protein
MTAQIQSTLDLSSNEIADKLNIRIDPYVLLYELNGVSNAIREFLSK